MPQLSEIVKERKKFKKIEYRAWDIEGKWNDENKHLDHSDSSDKKHTVIEQHTSSFESSDPSLNNPSITHFEDQPEPKIALTGTKTASKRTQIDHINESTRSQIDLDKDANRSLNKVKINPSNLKGHKEITEKITEEDANGYLIDHNNVNNFELATVVGSERELLFFIFSSCVKNRSSVTEPLTLEYINQCTSLRLTSIKTTINRLVAKNLIIRGKGKKGRSGWMRFELSNDIYNLILIAEKERKWSLNGSQTGNNYITQQVTEKITVPLSSSSNVINTTTTYFNDENVLDEDWINIDFSPLIEIGFGERQLKQLAKANKLTPDEVQESIYIFAYARKQPEIAKNIRSDHLNYFMGILIKKGEPYLPPAGYVSPKDIALREEIEKRKRRAELEKELKDLKFDEWYGQLKLEEKNTLIEQELTDEDKINFFGTGAKYVPEQVKEKKRREILKPYYFNVLCD